MNVCLQVCVCVCVCVCACVFVCMCPLRLHPRLDSRGARPDDSVSSARTPLTETQWRSGQRGEVVSHRKSFCPTSHFWRGRFTMLEENIVPVDSCSEPLASVHSSAMSSEYQTAILEPPRLQGLQSWGERWRMATVSHRNHSPRLWTRRGIKAFTVFWEIRHK